MSAQLILTRHVSVHRIRKLHKCLFLIQKYIFLPNHASRRAPKSDLSNRAVEPQLLILDATTDTIVQSLHCEAIRKRMANVHSRYPGHIYSRVNDARTTRRGLPYYTRQMAPTKPVLLMACVLNLQPFTFVRSRRP